MQSDATIYVISYLAQFAIGGVFGYVFGRAIRVVWKKNVFYAIGVLVVLLLFLSANGLIIVNWEAMQQSASALLSLSGVNNLANNAITYLPFSTAFILAAIYAGWMENKR